MGEFVYLPDGTLWMGNGVGYGTAGYGDDRPAIGQSYGQEPVYMPALYVPNAPAGGRWNRTGMTASSNERMYHSTAILLPDSSVLISGSNPNKDFTTEQWSSRTDAEKWYPWYYNEPRPTLPSSAPSNLTYGGASFDLDLNTTDETAVKSAMVVVIRGGFHTHAIGFGMKYLQLNSTYTLDHNTNASVLHVSQMPGNPGPTLFQPGPAMMFLVINGVPSMGEFIMVGSGELGNQTTSPNADLPASNITQLVVPQNTTNSSAGNSGANTSSDSKNGGATSFGASSLSVAGALATVMLSFMLLA